MLCGGLQGFLLFYIITTELLGLTMDRDSSVSIMTLYGLNGRGSNPDG